MFKKLNEIIVIIPLGFNFMDEQEAKKKISKCVKCIFVLFFSSVILFRDESNFIHIYCSGLIHSDYAGAVVLHQYTIINNVTRQKQVI